MSLCRHLLPNRVMLTGLLLPFVFAMISTVVQGQEEAPPKADFFAGYQWLDPNGKVPVPGSNPVVGQKMPTLPAGIGLALGYNFHRNFALELDYGGNWKDGFKVNTISAGPRVTWRSTGMNVFAHALIGLNRTDTPVQGSNGFGAIFGGGIDLPVTQRFNIRLFEADYQYARQNFASIVSIDQPELRRPNFGGARLRAGVVFNLGEPTPAVPPSASCSAQPTEVMVGEPVTVTANTSNFNPKHTLTYNWSSTGGKISGKETTATVETTGLAGGNYTATARVSDPKMKKGGEVSCSANFTVKEPPKNPPTMSCTANPTSLQAGANGTITCECKSPDNVEVQIGGWTASSGNISGTGNTGTLNTTGASPGTVNVSATCTDSRGLTAQGSTQVTVEAPPPPPPQSSKLSECEFPNKVKPWRVDNTCKAVLDDVAQALKNQADAKVVIVGFADAAEMKKRKNLAAERAVNAKAYLSGGEAKQAIDPSRIETRTGEGGGQKTEHWIVPAGASFNQAGTQPIDENKVKAIPDHPRPKPRAKAKAQQG